VPGTTGQFGRVGVEEMREVPLIAAGELDPDRIDQHQPVELRVAADRHLGGNPAAERKTYHHGVVGQPVEHLAVELHEVVHRVEILRQRRLAEPGMRWGNDLAVLGQLVDKRRLPTHRVDPVDEQDRLAAPRRSTSNSSGPTRRMPLIRHQR
jgi:hypothetical protein